MKFTIFQDPYLQGFLPTLYLYLYNLSGGQLAPPNTDTGLTVLTPGNVGQFTEEQPVPGRIVGPDVPPAAVGPHRPAAGDERACDVRSRRAGQARPRAGPARRGRGR